MAYRFIDRSNKDRHMRHFQKLLVNVPTGKAVNSVISQDLIGADNVCDLRVANSDAEDTAEMAKVAGGKSLALAILQLMDGTALGEVFLVRVPAKGSVAPHMVENQFDRFYVGLSCPVGMKFSAGEETITFSTGDVWWTDTKVPHAAENTGDDEALFMAVHVRMEREQPEGVKLN
jgi:uncharacterized RmlC-like cupin family protein